MHPWKSLGKIYSMVIFSKTLTEIITIKNPETNLKHGMSMKNFHY